MPASPSKIRRTHRTRFSSAAAILLAASLLSGCAKHAWNYVPPPPPAPVKPFDVQSDSTDPNGAPRNVDWHPQRSGQIPDPDACDQGQPYSNNCTNDAHFKDQPDFIKEAFCFIGKLATAKPQSFFGHADWLVAQYNGSIGWFNFGSDYDYDLFLIPSGDGLPPAPQNSPPNLHGLTTNNSFVYDNTRNPQYIEMEFDSNETNPAFEKGWWQQFQLIGDSDHVNVNAMGQLLHPDPEHPNDYPAKLACGSAVGLFGLDCDHGCRSELHPVYGLAIQTQDNPKENLWSVMARNWGTGGFCSKYNDQLAETSISIVLPYNSSQPPTSVEVTEFRSSVKELSGAKLGCPAVYFDNGQTTVNLTLPDPENTPVAAFRLKVVWPDGAQPATCIQPAPPAPELLARAEAAAAPGQKLKGEDYMGQLLFSATGSRHPNLEKDILPNLPPNLAHPPARAKLVEATPSKECEGPVKINPGPPPHTPPISPRPLKIDKGKQDQDEQIRTLICQKYRTQHFALPTGTTQQDIERACKGVK